MMRYYTFQRTAVAFVSICACTLGTHAQAADLQPTRNLLLQPSAAPALQSQRLALVIGNSAYKDAPLLNPVNDARAMAKALQDAGFTVMLHTDVDHRNLLGAVRDFGGRLRQGGVGLFYFAGHGMQIKGRNYLIPVGADIQREDEVAYAALDAQAVLDKMETAGNGANLMLLDACRNNPFARSFRSSTQGLAQMEAPVGTLVAFATAPGTVASDGQGKNGLYTQHLLAAMRKPGAKVEDVFKQVRAAVRRDSQGKQIPWEATSLEGDLYFTDPPPLAVAPPAPDPAQALDGALWETVKNSREPLELRAYLSRFPDGRFASAARQQLAGLEAARRPVVATSVQPPTSISAPNGSNWDLTSVNQARERLLQEPAAMPGSVAANDANADRKAEQTLAESKRPESSQKIDPSAEEDPAQQAEKDRVTALLLAEAADPRERAGADKTTAAMQQGAARTGLAVGDQLRYQQIDRWRRDVSKTFTLAVVGFGAGGVPTFAGDEAYRSETSRFWRQMLSPAAFDVPAQPGQPVWWGGMKRGDSRRVTMRTDHMRDDRSLAPADLVAKVTDRGSERVRVPAGEFEARHLEVDGQSEWAALSGKKLIQYWTMSLWYAPELHAFIATEFESREPGGSRLNVTVRDELTSFEMKSGRLAAR